jgi:CheY-like chemotaxis protein
MKKSEVVTPSRAFRILLIDDNRNGLLVRKSILEEHGLSVAPSSSAEDAVCAFRSSDFDLVITDYKMAKMSGEDVIRMVRESAKPSTPVVLISALVDTLGLTEKNTGADCVIPKSSTEAAHLVRAVNRLLRPAPRKSASSQTANRTAKRAAK